MADDWVNRLYFGDNLQVLREHIPDESVDLVYLDPPFNSNATYNVLFKETSGAKSSAQITAFDDTWHWGTDAEATYREVVEAGGKLGDLLAAMLSFLGRNDMMAYLTMMAPRLRELHRVLKPTGSLYLHCDPTASHYLKLVLDAIFSPSNFRNELTWQRTGAHSDANRWGRVNDVLLFYTKTDTYFWETQYLPYEEEYIKERYRYVDEPTGRLFWPNTMTAAGPGPARTFRGQSISPPRGTHWRFSQENIDRMEAEGRIYYSATGMPYVKSFLDEQKGRPVQSIWTDIRMTKSGFERLGYPTQKPESLLERILNASSFPNAVVLDPFCGCGTTIAVAERLHRRWIGIDITHLAITLIRHRLHDAFKDELHPYQVHGQPTDLEGARALAEADRHKFEWWALGMVDARPAQDRKKGADSGVDGRMVFFDDKSLTPRTIVLQVKSGHVGATHIRDLKGVVEREKAAIGVYITLEEPTKPMRKEAVAAGFYEPKDFPQQKVPKIQILTIEEILAGKKVEYPRVAPGGTFQVAERKSKYESKKPGRLL